MMPDDDAVARLMEAVYDYRDGEPVHIVEQAVRTAILAGQIAVLEECDQYVADAAVVAEISIQLEIARAALAALDGAA